MKKRSKKTMSTDDMMASLIQATLGEKVAGASSSAIHPDTGGTMMMFYFHNDASEQDIITLMENELVRTLETFDSNYNIPKRDPRTMN